MTPPASSGRAQVRDAALRAGIEPDFVDELGTTRRVPDRTLQVLIDLLGQYDDASCWTRLVDDTIVIRRTGQASWSLRLPLLPDRLTGATVAWTIVTEDGARHFSECRADDLDIRGTDRVQGRVYVRLGVTLPAAIPMGYHGLSVSVRAGRDSWTDAARLIVTPARTMQPARQRRYWGLTVQLYGVRSPRNWGIGDFSDLRAMLRIAGRQLGAAFVGVNPLHVLPPDGISPYSPSSRLFRAPWYLDIERIPDFREDPVVQRRVRAPAFQRRLARLRACETVDYGAVATLKSGILRTLYRTFVRRHLRRRSARARRFGRFIEAQGEALSLFSTFQALQDRFGAGWRQWPAAYRRPDTSAVSTFRRRAARRIGFHQYVQWLCDGQLAEAAAAARRSGMPIGLYQDLAVGIDPDGADAWAYQDELTRGVSVGAPPDLFSPAGQNWNLVPLHPRGSRRHGHTAFTRCVRQNMRHTGLLRIDHAMGLVRLFWIPDGSQAEAGAYVRLPADDILGILALETHRNDTILVGEDLGTITPEIRKQLSEAGLLSYRLLLFEKDETGAFLRPRDYPNHALAAASTHDLPTLRAFWSGWDIDRKSALGLYPSPELIRRDRAARERDRRALWTALQQERLVAGAEPPETCGDELCEAIYRFLSRTPARLVAVMLEDLAGVLEMPNIPGAAPDRYPVWRRTVGQTTDGFRGVLNSDAARSLAAAMRAEGRDYRTRLAPRRRRHTMTA